MSIVIIRALIIYFFVMITMRLLGKRQLGEMELSEFVLAALIADLAANPLQDIGIPMINGLVPIFTLFCCEIIIAGISMKSIRFRSLVFGRPSILVSHGVINQTEMRKNRFTPDELMQELRNQGGTDIAAIEYAILETDGRLNIIFFPAHSPVTPTQLGISPGDTGYPITIISCGRIIKSNLDVLGLDMDWLNNQLHSRHISSPKEVYLMSADSQKNIFFAPKEN